MEKYSLKSSSPSASHRGMLKLEEQFRNASSAQTDLQFDSLISPTNSKIAIPQIARSQPRNATRRAKRACLECRHRKTKCDGHQPCHQCDFFDVACEYSERKQERMKRRVAELEEQIDVYDQLLQRLRFKVDVQDREVIDRVLNQYNPSSFLNTRAEVSVIPKI